MSTPFRVHPFNDKIYSTFSLSFAEPLDPKLVSFIQILLDNEAWHRFEKHGKLPNPLIDENIAHIVRQVLAQRVGRYKTGYQANPSDYPVILRLTSMLHLTIGRPRHPPCSAAEISLLAQFGGCTPWGKAHTQCYTT